MCYIIPQSSKITSVIFNYMSRIVGVFYRKCLWLFKKNKKKCPQKEKSGYINKCVTAESVLLNESFQFTMRGQQRFSYLRFPAVTVTIIIWDFPQWRSQSKPWHCPIFLRIFTACGLVFVAFVLFCLAIFLLPLSCLLSLSRCHYLLCLFLFFFLSGKVQAQITFLLDLRLSVLKWPTYTKVNG